MPSKLGRLIRVTLQIKKISFRDCPALTYWGRLSPWFGFHKRHAAARWCLQPDGAWSPGLEGVA